MTPAQAFTLLRERCIEEITKGRGVRELTRLELAEILRLHGCRIPRFEGDDYDATMASYDWFDTEEGERSSGGLWSKPMLNRCNGKVPPRAGRCAGLPSVARLRVIALCRTCLGVSVLSEVLLPHLVRRGTRRHRWRRLAEQIGLDFREEDEAA